LNNPWVQVSNIFFPDEQFVRQCRKMGCQDCMSTSCFEMDRERNEEVTKTPY